VEAGGINAPQPRRALQGTPDARHAESSAMPSTGPLACGTAGWLAAASTAFVVDHGLRAESATEAEAAAAMAEGLGLRSRVLRVDWGGRLPRKGHKMQAARERRYELLLDACCSTGLPVLLTAHHAGGH
jgi:PP-loop family